MLQDSTEPVRAQGNRAVEDNARKSMDVGSTNVPKRASVRRMFTLATRWEIFVFTVGVFGAMGSGASQPVMIVLWGELIDSVMAERDIMDSLVQACWNMVILGAASMVFSALQQMSFGYFSFKQSMRYRGLYIDAVLHQDVAWFDLREAASLPTQMSVDGEKIAEAFAEKLGNSIMSGWSLLGGFVTGFLNGWQVALAALPAVPFMGLGAVLMTHALEQMQSETQGWYRKAAIVVEECLYAFRTVVSFGREKRELAIFDNALEQARKGGVANGFRQGASFGFTSMVMFLCYSSAFYAGAMMMYHDVEHPLSGKPYTVGNVVSVLFCIMIGGFGIGTLLPGYTAFQEGRFAMGRYLDAADTKTAIERRSQDERADCPPVETLEISEVHFSYPARPSVKVLKGLSLKINKGQRVAVVGESGSGKSTVMALLERFYDPDSGVVLVNGLDMKTFAAKSLRRSFGYVGQEPVLFATSVKENILQGSIRSANTDVELERVVAEAELNFVKELPKGLNTYVGTGGSQFSGGQKQRIAIARALIKNTSVLFFDEATSALDNKSEKMIQRTIDRISAKAEGNLTMVCIAHRLSTIQDSDRIYVLSRGLVVESGTHNELVQSKGTYYALAAAQKVASKTEEQEEGNGACDKAQASGAGPLAVQPADEASLAAREDGPALNRHVSHSTNPSMDPEAREAERVKQVAKEYKVPMARVMSFCRQEWIFILPAVLCAILEGAAQPVTALLLSQAMDNLHDASKSSMRDAMEVICILFAGFGIVLLMVTVLEHGCMAIVSEALTKRLRVALLQQFFRQEMGFHDDPENTPAKLGQAVELWTYRISNLVKAWGGKSGAFASIFVGLGLAFAYSWEMAVAMLLAIPVLSIASGIALFIMMGGLKQSKEGNLQAQQVLSDSVENARVCHACVNEEEIVSLYKSLVADANMGATRRAVLSGLAIGFSTGVTYWVFAAGFYWAGSLVDRGEREFGDVITAFLGITYAALGAAQCTMTLGDATKAKVAAHDIFKLLDRQTKIDSFEPEGETPSFASSKDVGFISFEAVRFRYPFRADVEVLKGMSFMVQQGQAAGLVGPSGGGKSTVMAMIQRFYDPDEGAICIGPEKKVLANLNICWWRRQLGFVGQEPILFDTTVRANLMYGICEGEEVSDEWLETCARMANLAFLDDEPSRFETQVGPRGSRLSGGQKQRVAICRALIRNPPVLLFDEATSALDTQSEQVVQSALEAARQGRTSFSIAHRLSTIADCQIILVVSSGVIVEQGSHQELIEAGGIYYTLVRATGKQ